MSDDDDALMKRTQAMQAAGEQRYGAAVWNEFVGSIGRSGAMSQDLLKQIILQEDNVGTFAQFGKQSLLNELQNGSPSDSRTRHVEQIYTKLREQEREAHVSHKNRGPR
jgi:hypothetical protein